MFARWLLITYYSFTIFIISLASPQSYAADWVRIATDKAGSLHEIDRDSLYVDKDLVHVWRKRIFTQTQTLGKNSFSWEISKIVFRCSIPAAMGMAHTTLYDSHGKYVDSYNYNPIKFSEPVPDSIGDFSRKMVCKEAATLAAKQKDEEANRAWFAEVERFKAFVRDREGIDYDANLGWADAWDSEVKRLAHLPDNKDKPARWFLEQAHMNVKPKFSKK